MPCTAATPPRSRRCVLWGNARRENVAGTIRSVNERYRGVVDVHVDSSKLATIENPVSLSLHDLDARDGTAGGNTTGGGTTGAHGGEGVEGDGESMAASIARKKADDLLYAKLRGFAEAKSSRKRAKV